MTAFTRAINQSVARDSARAKTRFARALAALSFCAGTAGCTGRSRPPADTLVVALGAQPFTLDPRYATDADGMRIGGLIFESLVVLGPGFTAEGQAAESWDYQTSTHTYTFHLRPNLRFHNGRLVTSDDLLYSFDFYRGDKSPFSSTLAVIKEVAVKTSPSDGRLTVHLRLDHDLDTFLISELPCIKILPKVEIAKMGNTFAQKLIGTGPFRFDKVDLNEIRLSGVRAQIKFVKFKVIRDDFTRFQKLLKGEVDLSQGEIPSDKVAVFERRRGDFQVLRYPGLSMTYLLINFRDPVLARLPVRQALSQSLRRGELIQFKLNGLANEATSLLTPSNPYFNSRLTNLAADPSKARKTIRDLGLVGRKFTLKTSSTPQVIDVGKVLAHQLGESGLEIALESYEWGTFYSDVKKGNFQLALMKWVGTVDPELYRSAFHSSELPPGRNRGAYINGKLDRLLDRADRAPTRDQRRDLFYEVQKMIQDDLAVIPLWYDEQVAIAGRHVLNYQPSLNSDFSPLAKVVKRDDEKKDSGN